MGVLFLLAIVVGIVWSSRLLPRGWWISASLPLPSLGHRSFRIVTGGNFLFFDVVRRGNQAVIGPKASNRSATDAFKKQFGSPRFHEFGLFKAWEEPAFETAANGQIEMIGGLTALGVPFGYLLVVLSVLPAWRLPRLVRRARARMNPPSGCCRHCGYDLRATPERCPECGRANSEEGDEGDQARV